MMSIESIRVVQTRKNYGKFINTLYKLDAILSGAPGYHGAVNMSELTNDEIAIIQHVFSSDVNNADVGNIDKYIIDTIKCFKTVKRNITLDISSSYYWKEEIQNMVLNKDPNDNLGPRWQIRERGDPSNIFSWLLLKAFSNVKQIIFKTDDRYTISLYYLLNVIKQSSLNKVSLRLGQERYYDKIVNVYNISSELRKLYPGYKISEIIEDDTLNNTGYCWCYIEKL